MIKEASIQRLNIFTFFPSGHINSSWAKLMAMWNLHNIFASFKIHFPRWWDLTYCWFSSFKSLYQAFFSYMTQQFLERVVRALLCRELSLINKTWIHSVAWKSRLKYENVLMEMEGVRGKELQGFIFIPSSFLSSVLLFQWRRIVWDTHFHLPRPNIDCCPDAVIVNFSDTYGL